MSQINTSAKSYGNCGQCGGLLYENLTHICRTARLPLDLGGVDSDVGARGRMVEFTVRGEAQPAGSKKGFYNKKIGRVIIADDATKSRPWKAIVADAALEAMGTASPLNGALRASFSFYETRPKSHYTTKGELNATGRRKPFPTKKPDVLKLARAVEDALSTIVYVDDAQIVAEVLSKAYGNWDGVIIRVEEM